MALFRIDVANGDVPGTSFVFPVFLFNAKVERKLHKERRSSELEAILNQSPSSKEKQK